MNKEYEDIESVLALFDLEDIPYIKSNKLKISEEEREKEKQIEKIKVLGDKNDGTRS